jgi:hypothetical protein
MFSLSRPILLVGMRTRNMMLNAYFLKERIYFLILSTPIRLDNKNFLIKLVFNKFLEIMKDLKDIRLLFEKTNPRKFTKIINEAYIISKSPYGSR